MDYEHLHEVEIVMFRSERARPRSELVQAFCSQGFTLHDDVLRLNRADKHPAWQHSSFVEVEIRHQDKEVFGFDEGDWDQVRLEYLFAYLPFEATDVFSRCVETTSQLLGVPPILSGQVTDKAKMRDYFQKIRLQLIAEVGDEPGSEPVAIFIRSTYPRRGESSR